MKKFTNKDIPSPSVMPIDRKAWASQLHLSNFVNTFYQYRDLQLFGNVKTLLIIGPGQGLDTHVLKWRMYEVTTFDIDEMFNPNVIGSVHDLSMFKDGCFDVVIASHVLEHLPVPYLDRCLSELARVSKYCLIYLPVAGRHFQLRAQLDLKGIDLSIIFDLYNYFRKPDGITPNYCAGQHYWEIGMRGFRVGEMTRRLSRYFKVMSAYRNKDWLPSYNFILESKRHL